MKIDDLVANLERNAQEQNKIMTEKIRSVTNQHLASYNELLQSNLKATQKILDDQQATIRQSLSKLAIINRITAMTSAIMVILMIGLGLGNLWLYKKSQDQTEVLIQIQDKIDQSPLEAKILSKVEIGEENGTYFIISNHKKATTYTSDKKQQVLTFPSN